MEELKSCSACKVKQPKENFTRHRAKCKSCRTEQSRQWRLVNAERHNEYQAKYKHKRYSTDINFKIKAVLRARLRKALQNDWKVGSSVELLGCSVSDFKIYLESKFEAGMTWDNWGVLGWHIDHIVPLNSFDLSNKEELKIACHYTNLQPLWFQENAIKSDKVE